MAAAGSSGSVIIEGFGVNANSASWKHGELPPALDLLVEQLGVMIFRIAIDNAHGETTNNNDDALTSNWTFDNSVYPSPKFETLWSTKIYFNQ
jgi:hypothetical protein